MNVSGKTDRVSQALPWVFALYAAATLLHFAHNAQYLAEYPHLPASWSRADVYLAWCGLTAAGLFGYSLYWLGRTKAGLAVLALYAILGFAGLLHYTRAPMAHHSAMMNVTIWAEAVAGALLLANVVMLRRVASGSVTLSVLANIDVDNLARATTFYRDALGLRVGRRLGSSAVELLGGSTPIYLLEKASGTEPSPTSSARRNYSRHWTPVHLDLVVQDIFAAVARAQGAGATLEGDVRTYNWGRIAAMADPFGHGFCLIEFLGRGYDELAS